MNFIFSKVSLMAPAGDAAGAALGARGVACFLLFLEEASLLFVLRFLPMSTRAACAAAAREHLSQELAARTRCGYGLRSYTGAMRLVSRPWSVLYLLRLLFCLLKDRAR